MWATPLAGDLVADETRTEDALRLACENGHLDTARWLTKKFALTAADARRNGNYALRWACANGHLDAARWLTKKFALTPADARSWNNHALRLACANGHLDAGALAHRENSG